MLTKHNKIVTTDTTPALVGRSLSFCVQDLVKGRVDYADVLRVETNTRCATPEEWARVLVSYSKVYWALDPALGIAYATRLMAEGRITQPRMEGKPVHSIADGWWCEVEVLRV